MSTALTSGIHHLGLTVSKLEASADFFISQLGWKEVKRRPEYPAIFVSDGKIMLTLWSTRKEPFNSFDKDQNVGLHHVALAVESEAVLNDIYHRLDNAGIAFEFMPEFLGEGPAKHMMCYDPSGIRVEIIWPGV